MCWVVPLKRFVAWWGSSCPLIFWSWSLVFLRYLVFPDIINWWSVLQSEGWRLKLIQVGSQFVFVLVQWIRDFLYSYMKRSKTTWNIWADYRRLLHPQQYNRGLGLNSAASDSTWVCKLDAITWTKTFGAIGFFLTRYKQEGTQENPNQPPHHATGKLVQTLYIQIDYHLYTI